MPFALPATMRAYTVALCLEQAWIVRLTCDRCDREPVLWREAELLAMPADAALGGIAARTVCGGCGSRDGEVMLMQGHWGERATWSPTG